GFDVHLPLAAEPVEVVDERPAHEHLNRSIHILDVDTLLEDLVAIHGDELLRHIGQERGRHRGEFRTLPRGGNQLVRVVREKGHVASRAVLQDERESAGRSHTGNGRRRKRKRYALTETGEFLVHALPDELVLLFALLPVLPFLQRHEEECAVARTGE